MKYLGADFPPGFTCWDFVCKIYQETYGVTLHPYAVNGAVEPIGAAKAARDELARPEWGPIATPEAGCLVVMGKGRATFHAGVAVTPSLVIHLMDNGGVRVQDMANVKAAFQTTNFFRHATFHPCSESA